MLRNRTLRQFSRNQCFIVLTQTQRTTVQRLSPENKGGLTLYTFASRLQKQKANLNPPMAAYDFIGYFIPLVLCDLLHVSIL
jgi:hypothetical protein